MKIEKISENQIKFILSKSDLDERDIKISELAYGSEKTHRLLQEMMNQAYSEYNFDSDNMPLLTEVMPVGTSQVIIVVTKISEAGEEKPLNFFNQNRPSHPFKTYGFMKPNDDAAYMEDNLAVFSFKSLDEAAVSAKRLYDSFMGQSRLYKCDNRYFLVIEEDSSAAYALAEAVVVLHEYGEKHISTSLGENYLAEHGEIFISRQAVEKLAQYL